MTSTTGYPIAALALLPFEERWRTVCILMAEVDVHGRVLIFTIGSLGLGELTTTHTVRVALAMQDATEELCARGLLTDKERATLRVGNPRRRRTGARGR